MKTVIEMAREAGIVGNFWPELERFAELVSADESEKHKWDIHSCGPTCEKKGCVAVREAVLSEREACAQLCEDIWQTAHDIQDAIRARGAT